MLKFTDKGIYCPPGKFYIDPWKPVKHAVITHAHSDHSKPGMKHYLAHSLSIPVMKYRLGEEISIEGVEYGETKIINGVKVSLHPAGHIPGSAQVRLEHKGEVWVVSGDYKLTNDGFTTPYEIVKCHHFITESTFGLPVFRWPDQKVVQNEINEWWRRNAENNTPSVVFAYALGKAQRLINLVNHDIGPVFTHGAIENTNEVLRNSGLEVKPTTLVSDDQQKSDYQNALIIAAPSAEATAWMKRFGRAQTGIVSGWMMMRGMRRRRNADRGFVLSDHADWDQLLEAIHGSEAQKVYVTHGYTETFTNYLQEIGVEAEVVRTDYQGDDSE